MARRIFLFFILTLAPAISASAIEFRDIDGRGNNMDHPEYGQVGQPLGRYLPAIYVDNAGEVDPFRPNPREISNAIFAQEAPVPDPLGLSNLSWAWGQFIDHDITHSLIDAGNGVLAIEIPVGDPVFDTPELSLAGESIRVSRSEFVSDGVDAPREQVNNVTSWLDASMIYGGRATDGPAEVDRPSWLRTGVGGKLRVSDGGPWGALLPKYVDGLSPEMANTHRPTMTGIEIGDKAFVAGDVRANENPALLALHTLFVREHNRLAEIATACGVGLGDEEIFQRARKIVGAEIQAITYNEYLPTLGLTLDDYSGYDESVDPAIKNEFANAAFRMGHSQVDGMIPRLTADGQPLPGGNLNLVDSFFAPEALLESGLEPIFRGLAATVQQATDAKIVGELRNQLFQRFNPEVGLVDDATDLAAVNILRGRDHGLATYNETRQAVGLPRLDGFDGVTSDPAIQAQLAIVYSSIDEVDLYVGLLAEDPLPGASVGETLALIISDQFQNLRDGDRFWYENDLEGINADLMCVNLWDGELESTASAWLDSLTIADVIHLNTLLDDMSGNMFMAQPVPEPSCLVSLSLGMSIMLGCRRCRRRTHGL